jgi:hypothetical protein
MSLEIYWLVVGPVILAGLSGVGWLTLWFTRDREKRDHAASSAVNRL